MQPLSRILEDCPTKASENVRAGGPTPEEARARIPALTERALEVYGRLQAAQAEWLRLRGELAILRDVARGEFERDYAAGSNGSCRVA